MTGKITPAPEVEAQVQAIHPYFRLDRASYEQKDLQAAWHCSLRGRNFRAKAAALVRPTSAGSPECLEERTRRKRRAKRAYPDLEPHLALIRKHCRKDFARTYQLHCDGVKWEDIGAEFGISIQGVQGRLLPTTKVLSEAAPRELRRNDDS